MNTQSTSLFGAELAGGIYLCMQLLLSPFLHQKIIKISHSLFRVAMKSKMKAGEKKGCESCREWQEHYYWEHMDATKIRFIKLMAGDFDQRIRIPDKFASNFIRQMVDGFDLKVPSGETWHVGVTKVANELFFRSGWGDFAKAHELQENDFLLFTSTGSSSFEVLIFDASGCEKLSSLFAGQMHKHFDNMAGQEVEHYSQCQSGNSDDDDDDVTSAPPQSHKTSSSKKFNGRGKPRKESESPKWISCDVKQEEIVEEESDHDRYDDPNYYYSKCANRLTDEEKQEIIGLALTKPDNPAFVVVLQKCSVQLKNIFLIISKRFAADHLQKKSHGILLVRPNREEKWHVRFYHGRSTRGLKCCVWAKFVRDNKLRKDDVCVFEVIKGAKRTTMAVHIIRRRKGDSRFVAAK